MPFVSPAGYSSVGYSSIGYSVIQVETTPEVPLPELTDVAVGITTTRRLKLRSLQLLRSTRPTRTMHTRQYIGFSSVRLTVQRLYLSRSTISLQIPERAINAETVRTSQQLPSSYIRATFPQGVALQPSRLTLQTQSAILSSVSLLRLGNANPREDRLRRLQKVAEITSFLT